MDIPTLGGTCIPANPDVSGIGVRSAIYAQTFLSFVPAIFALYDGVVSLDELATAQAQSTTVLITALAILMSSIVQSAAHEISGFHALIVLLLSWMNNTITFVYFVLYMHRKGCDLLKSMSKGNEVAVGTTSFWKDRVKLAYKDSVLLVGSGHLCIMAIVGVYIWSWADSSPCADEIMVVVIGAELPLQTKGLKVLSLLFYVFTIIPLVNLVLPMFILAALYFLPNRRRFMGQDFRESVSSKSKKPSSSSSSTTSIVLPSTAPIYVGLIIFALADLIFLINIELTIRTNADILAKNEQEWTFGQVLALALLLVPLRDIVVNLIHPRVVLEQLQRQKRRLERLEKAAENDPESRKRYKMEKEALESRIQVLNDTIREGRNAHGLAVEEAQRMGDERRRSLEVANRVLLADRDADARAVEEAQGRIEALAQNLKALEEDGLSHERAWQRTLHEAARREDEAHRALERRNTELQQSEANVRALQKRRDEVAGVSQWMDAERSKLVEDVKNALTLSKEQSQPQSSVPPLSSATPPSTIEPAMRIRYEDERRDLVQRVEDLHGRILEGVTAHEHAMEEVRGFMGETRQDLVDRISEIAGTIYGDQRERAHAKAEIEQLGHRLQQEFERQILKLKKEYDESVEKLKKEHEEHIKKLKEEHDESIEKLKKEIERKDADHEAELEKEREERSRLEAIIRENIPGQDRGTPSKSNGPGLSHTSAEDKPQHSSSSSESPASAHKSEIDAQQVKFKQLEADLARRKANESIWRKEGRKAKEALKRNQSNATRSDRSVMDVVLRLIDQLDEERSRHIREVERLKGDVAEAEMQYRALGGMWRNT